MTPDILPAEAYFAGKPNTTAERAELAAAIAHMAVGDWVRFHVRIPVSERNTFERTNTISGVVKDIGSEQILVKVQCLPDDADVHGLNWDSEVWIPVSALNAVSKPVPPTRG